MSKIDESQIMLVARRWARRSKHTSVERFLDYFPDARKVTSSDAFQRPYRFLKYWADRTGQDGYTSHSFGLELAALWRIVRYRPKIVHFLYADHDYHYLAHFARLFGCKIIGTFWFSIEEFERRIPNKSHLACLDHVVASGEAQARYLAEYVPAERITYLPLGIDTDFFRPSVEASERFHKPHILLQVGVNRRDFETLRLAFRQLRQTFPNAELHMVGCREAQPLFADEQNVIFHPFLDDEALLALYQRAALLLLPLLEGGSSNALNEALATGLPIVATEMPNLRDYVSAQSTALCSAHDAVAMATVCRRLLENLQEMQTMAQCARLQAEQFDWKTIRQQYTMLYNRL